MAVGTFFSPFCTIKAVLTVELVWATVTLGTALFPITGWNGNVDGGGVIVILVWSKT